MKMKRILVLLLPFLCLLHSAPPVFAESILRVCDDVEPPASLNPFQVFSEKTHTIIQQVMEGLLRFNSEGKFEPVLAESWERLNDTTVRFHLRKGVLFQNGEPFNAQAVKSSFERYVSPGTNYPGIGFVATISSVSIVDDFTADVITHIPDGLLLNRLAAWGHIVPPQYYSQAGPDGFAKQPVGTGPFKFYRWEKGRIILSKNENYWMKGFPKLDKLVFHFIPAEQQMDELLNGKLDLITELPGSMTLHTLEGNPNLKIVKKFTYNAVVGPMNTSEGPLKDVRIRKALNYAIDKDEMIRYDLLMNGRAIATTTMEGEEGHNPALTPYPYDVEKAKALLKEAGIKENDLTLDVVVKEQGRRTIGIVKADLAKIGVNLNVHYTNDANILKDIASKKWDMAFGNCSDPMVHSFFIQSVMFYSKSPFSIGHNYEYDGLLGQMMVALDPEKRQELGKKLDSYIYNQALGIFTYQRLRTYGAVRRLHFEPYVSGMSYFFATYFGEPTKPVEMK